MSALTYGELFAGYGGLGMGVQSVLGGEMRWCAEFDKAPSRILEARYPDAPNLGDVTKVDWSQVEPVDVITGGFPCQDVSHAGRRAGLIRDGEGRTRSGLWGHMLRAIDTLRPRLVVVENVRGLLSATADSDVEPCPWCMGDAGASPMRALGAVLADLADGGYDAQWYGLRAADVGAPHGRFRVFVFAWPAADTDGDGLASFGRWLVERRDAHRRDGADGYGAPAAPEGMTLLPTPVADNSRGLPSSGTDYASLPNAVAALLPTPAVNDMGEGKTPEAWDAWTAKMQAAHGNGNGHGKSLSIEAQRLLPTPSVADGMGGHLSRSGSRSNELLLPGVAKGLAERNLLPTPMTAYTSSSVEEWRARRPAGNGGVRDTVGDLRLVAEEMLDRWGDYAPAIARWEAVLGRPAPDPTEPGAKGSPRLSPRFVEFMMGLPAGWVTDVDISRNEQLKALGNGVVPQQAAAATAAFVADLAAEGVAA